MKIATAPTTSQKMNDKRDATRRNILDTDAVEVTRRDLISRLCACGVMVTNRSFLDVEDTRTLKTSAIDIIKHLQARRVSANIRLEESKNLFTRLHALGETFITVGVVVFNSKDELLGAVVCNASAVLQSAECVWDSVEDDLIVVTNDLSHGLCIEKNYYSVSGEYVRSGIIEVTAWGNLAI